MSIREIDFVKGEYYHLYNRGNSKQKIFLDDRDRERFLKLLYLCNSKERIDFKNDIVKRKIDAWDFEKGKSIVNIGAWVLMPNHFHLYITPKTEALLPSGNAITDYMHRVLTAYSKYFNARYKRTGSLFEGKFKSIHVTKDTQAKYLFSYIHLNPLKLINPNSKLDGSKASVQSTSKFMEFLKSYKWSSYFDYLDIIRPENKILNRIDFLDYFESKKSFQKEIFEWIKIKAEEEG
ncbi:MAG: transposase [Candidatus Nomurabacteria bacterium]|nr:transposase [Candidatus Nomurabacteria bacterium]